MEERKVLLSAKDLVVKFRVRGRTLTAIRGISLDIYENESIAIVGESGSGKSVFTKTFAGMLDENGSIDSGSLIYNDEVLARTVAPLKSREKAAIEFCSRKLLSRAPCRNAAEVIRQLRTLEKQEKARYDLPAEEARNLKKELDDLKYHRTQAFNQSLALDKRDRAERRRLSDVMADCDRQIRELTEKQTRRQEECRKQAEADTAAKTAYENKKAELTAKKQQRMAEPLTEETKALCLRLAKEIVLSVDRVSRWKQLRYRAAILKDLKTALENGEDLTDDKLLNRLFARTIFRVQLQKETETQLEGTCELDLAKIRENSDWTQIRGRRIATVFQDPMTSLNPVLTIGSQISSIIMKHQGCSEAEARLRALELMGKVGIPQPENRYDDYPFQYSGGMRQRIVIAIALSCQPKILICDEPTTALDVTIQAQILQLIKDLQKEFGYTIVFITHDLGVVANIADRVAVLYAGQVVEVGTAEEVFYDPRHPYTWALLSSLPQLAQKNTKLYSITGTPPSLYNDIHGDAFAPRNPYCMQIDTLAEPPMFRVTDTHYAKTWLLHPDAPKQTKPETIENIHEKLMKAFNISEKEEG